MRMLRYTMFLISLLAFVHAVKGQYRHPRHVISGAGGRMSSPTVKLEGTITQTAIGYLGGADSTAHVGFWYPVVLTNQIDTTTIVLLLPDMRVKTGDVVEIPIRQENGRWPYGKKPASVTVAIAFNGSILQPLDPTSRCPVSGFCTVNINTTPLATDGILGTIKCRVKLGDAEESPLRIAEVTWPPNSRVRTIVRHGNLIVTDICHQGDSTRLIIAGEATRLMPPRPMPANDVIEIDFTLAGRTPVLLSVVDVAGNVISEVLREERKAGAYSIRADVSALPNGKYFALLRTTDGTFMQPLMVLR